MQKNLIIDGNSMLNRAFYALPIMTNEKGEYLNAVYGFCNMLIRFISDEKPDNIVVAFDYGKKTFRHDLYQDYKAGRNKTPEELVYQFPLIKETLKAMHIQFIEIPNIEADDIIGTLSLCLQGQNIVLSGDKDVLQLVSDKTTVYLSRKGIKDVDVVTPKNIKELFGYDENEVVDYKGLCGDSSDNLPGVPGVGEKTAKTLLDKYGSVENVYNHIDEISGKLKDKLIDGKESAFLCKQLAKIKTDCDLNDFQLEKYLFPFDENIKKLFSRFEFESMLKRSELFSKTTEKKEEIKDIILDEISFLNLIKNFNNTYISFKILNDFFVFSFDNNLYKIENNILLKNKLYLIGLFENAKILKITYDLKEIMHFFGTDSFENVFDISIADYLICSTKKTNDELNVLDFYEKQKKLIEKLKELNMEDLYFNIEFPLAFVLFNMENNGIKIDLIALEKLRNENYTELKKIEEKIIEMAGENFNINSSKQLQHILFEKLNIKCPQKKLSTANEVLVELESRNPIISLIMRQRKLQKLQSAYLDSFTEIAKKSGDIIHTVYNQTLTSTGRLSSSEPNLQNIPVRDEEGKFLRSLFVSKFENGSLISADYNQIELRLLAHFSKDKNLCYAFNEGVDIHSSTASKVFGKPESDINSAERRKAKAVNFGIIYGISDFGLSKNLGISRKDAKSIIERYFEVYSDIKSYLNANVDFAREHGYSETIFGRRRYIAEINDKIYSVRSFGERVAMNMPLQGSASDIIKVAMLNVQKKLAQEKLYSQLVMQIHDELVVDVFPGEENAVKSILKECMENVVKLFVPLPVVVASGKNLLECK